MKNSAISISLVLEESLQLLALLIEARIKNCYCNVNEATPISVPSIPKLSGVLADIVRENKLGNLEYWTVVMALLPHIRPSFLDQVIQEALPQSGDFPQIGGTRGKQFRGFLPTGETVLFVLGGEDWEERQKVKQCFQPDQVFARKKILWLEIPPEGEPMFCGKLLLNTSYVAHLTTGKAYLPHFSTQFPAQLLKTKMKWNDLVLNPHTHEQINELRAWLKYNQTLLGKMGMARKIRPGYRVLFYGPPGTGKTLTATLIGQEFKKEVFRVDLSMVVSKYIGETEKNLARLFDEAENQNWILFFDEADALFGKRTQVKDAHDRFANQEVSYLMQRIEIFEGLVILATNLKGNMDDAFSRRFQSIIYFPFPSPEEQLAIWEMAFPKTLPVAKDVDLMDFAKRYKLSGANIMNIVHFSCLEAMANELDDVPNKYILKGLQRELMKEGRSF